MIRPLLLALLLGSTPLTAQQPGIAGTWKVTYVAGTRMEGGEATPLTATGTLTIERRGDSLTGTLVMDPQAELPTRPPVVMTGLLQNGAAVLTTTNRGNARIDGEDHPITVMSTWTIRADGDALSGTTEREILGLPADAHPAPGGAAPVTGRRQGR